MIQIIGVTFIFLTAVVFVGRKLYLSFFSKKHNCDGCAVSQILNDKTH